LANQGQLLSQISGYEETEFDTLIPQINTTADIVEAFKQYHYGYADFNGTVNPSPNSIHSHLLNIDTRLTTQENTQVWVDRDYDLTSFNASLYATQSAFDILENTVTQLSIRLDGVEALALGL